MRLKRSLWFWAGSALIPFIVVACSHQPDRNAVVSNTCGSPLGGPTDNPVRAYYGTGAYPWTDEVRWECVYNIRDFVGVTDQARFEAARATALAHGGGVIYFPEGTYRFSEDLTLGDGIVLRGAEPTGKDARDRAFRPLTRLEFPKYEPSRAGTGTPNETAFKKILTQSPDTDSNLGLVYLDINRAAVEWGGDPDQGTMGNRLVFGIRSNNVAEPDPSVPDTTFQPGWLRFSNRFAANIRITVSQNALVANNRLNDDVTDHYNQAGYVVQSQDGQGLVTYAEGEKGTFSYTDHYGIVVNRSKAGGFRDGASPEEEPGLFREGISIVDNWIFKTMRVAIQASGQGLLIQGNEIQDLPKKQAWIDPTGKRQPRGAMTFENRGIDWSGHGVVIDGNTYTVYRHQIMDSDYASTDGEGILIQSCCGGTSVNGVNIRNNQGQGYIGIYKVPEISKVQISGNTVTSHSPDHPAIYVNADPNGGMGSMTDVSIHQNTVNGGIFVQASRSLSHVLIEQNRGQGRLTYSCGVEVKDNQGLEAVSCREPPQGSSSTTGR